MALQRGWGKKLSIIVYLLLLSLISVIGLVVSFSSYSRALAVLDAAVDLIIFSGSIIYLLDRRYPFWRWPLAAAFVGEIILLVLGETASPIDIALVIVMVAPAFYLNYRVAYPKRM